MNNNTMELNLNEMELVSGGGVWDVIFDCLNDSLEIIDEVWIAPTVPIVELSIKQVVNEAADKVVDLGNKVYDVI